MHKKSLWIYICIVLLILASCSGQTDSSQQAAPEVEQDKTDPNENHNEKSAELEKALEAPDAPQTTEDLIAYPSGPLAGQYYDDNRQDIEETLAELPKLNQESDEETVKRTGANYYPYLPRTTRIRPTLLKSGNWTNSETPSWMIRACNLRKTITWKLFWMRVAAWPL